MRMIDANALENRIRTNAKVETNDTQYDVGRVHGLINAADLIHNAPTVDAIPVVRCKDCGDWREHGDFHICKHFSSIDLPGLCKNIIFTTRPDDYCSSGFRIKQSETETEESQ